MPSPPCVNRGVTMTGSFPARVRAARATFSGTVTLTNDGHERFEALSASRPDVYVKQGGAIVAGPLPRDDVGLVIDLAPGATREFSATGSLRRDGRPLAPGRYEVHVVLERVA